MVQNWWNSRAQDDKEKKERKNSDSHLHHDIEEAWQRAASELGDDFTEVATLFAAAIWFAPVFPLGMLLALFHAVTETASDRYKMCFVARRSLPDRHFAVMYDAWLQIMNAISIIGVCVCVALTYVSHEGNWSFHELACVEHVILFVKLYLLMNIPAEPEWLNHHLSHI